jgi:hypothetical protein
MASNKEKIKKYEEIRMEIEQCQEEQIRLTNLLHAQQNKIVELYIKITEEKE